MAAIIDDKMQILPPRSTTIYFMPGLIVAEKISVPESCLSVFRFWQNIEAASGSKAILSCPLLIPAFYK